MLLLCSACAAPAKPPPVASIPLEPPPAQTERPISLDLVDAPATEVLAALQGASERPVLVQATAIEALSCVRVTVHESGMNADTAMKRVEASLEAHSIHVRREGRGWIIVADDDAPRCRVPPNGDSPPAPAAISPAADSSIHENSPTDHTMSRAALDQLFNDPTPMQARIEPATKKGTVMGLAVRGVRESGVAWRLGFRDGDLLKTVNGSSVSSPERALESYARIRTADELHVVVERDGRDVDIFVHVTR